MPELPEVETIVRDLNKKILDINISNIDIRLKKIVKNNPRDFASILKNNSFKKIRRRGKFLIFELSKNDKLLLIHLRMTGQLIYQNGKKIIAGGHSDNTLLELPNKHSHIVFKFQGGGELFYNDIRQFGIAYIINCDELEKNLERFGIEPLGKKFTLGEFKKILKNKKTNIKAFLLNQKYVVGIGNIYADEILFDSKISPLRKTNTLGTLETKRLHSSIRKILKKAIKARGTTFNNYVDADGNKGGFLKYLKVYQKDGQLCHSCKKNKILKIRIAGRGTRYCRKCQK